MYSVLRGLNVVECSSFVAGPTCGLYLLQMGAQVVRIDNIGGGPDFNRWPRYKGGLSLYWEGLNKGKKSVALDLASPEGKELAVRIATAPGPERGLFLTNFPLNGFLSHANLVKSRADLITVRIMGWANGRSALDYTVNCATGIPLMTGPAELGDAPVNHVLPAWDLLAGASAAYAMLAAERYRRQTGHGQEVYIPLGEIGMATMGNLGQIAEVVASGESRERLGNDIYGAFGRNFATADGHQVMVLAVTPLQWSALLKALDIGDAVQGIERSLGVSFAKDEGVRFEHRKVLFPLVEAKVGRMKLPDLKKTFDELGVCWEPYQTIKQALDADPRFSAENPLFSQVTHPSGLTYLTPGASLSFNGLERMPAKRAPRLGEHTDEVLMSCLGMSSAEVGKLHDRGLAASA